MNDLKEGQLRRLRLNSGLSADEVVDMLRYRGIEINSKTLYGYEQGVSTPRVNTFIALCDIYKVHDIMAEFGYGSTDSVISEGTNPRTKKLVSLADELNEEGQERLLDYADDLVSSGKYKKYDSSQLGQREA